MEQLKLVIEKLKLNVLSIQGVPESFGSTVYKIKLLNQQTVFIKIPYTKVKLAREYEAFEILKDELPVPKRLDYWEGNDEIIGAFVLSELKGQALSGKVDGGLAFDIGVNHAKLHNVSPIENHVYQSISNVYTQWSTFLETQFYSFAEDVKLVISEELYVKAIEHFEQQQKLLPPPDGPSFIHMDFRPANIIVENNKVSGVIDFESVRFGATEIDFTKINRDIFMKNDGTLDAYKKGYETIRPLIDLDIVLPFYRFTDAFNSIGWCKRRGLNMHQQFFDENYTILTNFLRE